MSIPVKLPASVVKTNGLPRRDMTIVSVWPMGDDFGLWVGENTGPGQRWPLTGISKTTVEKWIEAARGGTMRTGA